MVTRVNARTWTPTPRQLLSLHSRFHPAATATEMEVTGVNDFWFLVVIKTLCFLVAFKTVMFFIYDFL